MAAAGFERGFKLDRQGRRVLQKRPDSSFAYFQPKLLKPGQHMVRYFRKPKELSTMAVIVKHFGRPDWDKRIRVTKDDVLSYTLASGSNKVFYVNMQSCKIYIENVGRTTTLVRLYVNAGPYRSATHKWTSKKKPWYWSSKEGPAEKWKKQRIAGGNWRWRRVNV